MVKSERIIVASVSESCVAENVEFSRGSIIIKDVLLTDDASFDFSGDFSLHLTETCSGTLFEEPDDDDCIRGNKEESNDEAFVKDEESMVLMSAMGLPTTFVTNSNLRGSKDIRTRNRPSRRKNRKVTSSFDNPSPPNHMLFHQHNSYQSYDERKFGFTWDNASQGFSENLPSSADPTLALPVHDAVQELSIDTDIDNDEGGSAGLVQNFTEMLDSVYQVSKDSGNELDGNSNHEAVVSPWVPCWDHQFGRYYFFNSETLDSTWEPPKGLEHCVYFSVNKGNKDILDDPGTEACGESNVQQVPKECIGNSKYELDTFPWVRCWDDQYGRYYFCNSKTLETTWEVPDGLESWVCSSAVEVEDSKAMEDDAEAERCGMLDGEGLERELLFTMKAVGTRESLETQLIIGLHNDDLQSVLPAGNDPVSKGNELPQACKPCANSILKTIIESGWTGRALTSGRHGEKSSTLMMEINHRGPDNTALVKNHSSNVSKYWIQRFHLFSKFNAGVKFDEEGLFSVTPEIIAKHQAARCNHGVIVDAFAGVGGNAIQFALAGHYVVAIDNDPRKIEYAHHNASIYGVADCIDFLLADFFIVSSSLQADVVFLSPPWGGPEYLNVAVYDIQTMLEPKDGMSLFRVAQAIAPNVIFFLPRNVNVDQLAELSQKSSPHLACEVERNFLNGKLKAITAYYGHFAFLD